MKEEGILRVEEILRVEGIMAKGYGILPKFVMQDRELELSDKGLYAYFCSLTGSGDTTWPRRETVMKHLKIGKDAYYASYGRLIKRGYITVQQQKNSAGQWALNIYTLVSNPACFQERIQAESDYDSGRSTLQYSGMLKNGFGMIPRAVMQSTELSVKEKGVYAYLITYAGPGQTAFPTTPMMANHLNITRVSLRKYISHICELGYITRKITTDRKQNGQFSGQSYTISNTIPDFAPIGDKKERSKKPAIHKKVDSAKAMVKNPDTVTAMVKNPDTVAAVVKNPDTENPDTASLYKSNTSSLSNTKSNPIPLPPSNTGQTTENDDSDRYDGYDSEKTQDSILDSEDEKRQQIKQQIEYWYLIGELHIDVALLNEIVEIMIEVEYSTADTIRVARTNTPRTIVQKRFRQLTSEHIQYVLDCMDKCGTSIRNIKSYLMTALYNAPATLNHFFRNWVNQDM